MSVIGRGGSRGVLGPHERIEQTIRIVRGHRVMLDTDLAERYGVDERQEPEGDETRWRNCER
jgi:hypothetical protein